MEPRFTTRPDRVIDVDLGPQWTGFTEALLDAVTTRAPVGSDEDDPSTYWLDRTLLALAFSDRAGARIAAGNATELIRRGDQAVARSTYDLWDDQAMPLGDLVTVLGAWKDAVLSARRSRQPAPFDVELRWKETVVYWEGRHGYVLDASWGIEPPVLHVPAASVWDDVVPAWLRGRRETVVSRLADASGHTVRVDDQHLPDLVRRCVER